MFYDAVAAVLAGDPLRPGVTSPPHVWGSKHLEKVLRVLRRMTERAQVSKNGHRICSVCDLLGLGLLREQAKAHPTVISHGAMDDIKQR
eukprot:3711305-Heterocapsa_arctica.AAC.1